MGTKIEMPPQLSGNDRNQMKTLYGYLYRMAETLNVALDAVGGNGGAVVRVGPNGEPLPDQPSDDQWHEWGKTYNELKALIIKNAEILQVEMDKQILELNQKTTAISQQFGTFQESIGSTITMTAENILQSYGYESRLDALDEQNAGFSAYQIKTEGFIRSGFIDYDDYGVPIIGIAIGQGLRSVKVTHNGTEYDKFDASQSCAFYTAEKVSFRVQGQEVAYISNRKMYIRDVEITGRATFGNWEFSHDDGLTIKWIGG